jgi:hypothetical protein
MSRASVPTEGSRRPCSYAEMTGCEVPARSASSACVNPERRRAAAMSAPGSIPESISDRLCSIRLGRGLKHAVCLEGRGAWPPEDCGGSAGYADLLAALADPEHTDHDELVNWLGGPFDPRRSTSPR